MNATSAPPSYEQCAAAARNASTDPCDGPAACTRCLQTWGCMIDSYGTCVTQGYDDYNKYADFTLAAAQGVVLPGALTTNASLLSNRQYWYFRAGDATYCSRNDTVCRQCAAAKFWTEGRPQDLDSRYCRGADGCVCISNCESVMNAACSGWTPAPSTQAPNTTMPSPTSEITRIDYSKTQDVPGVALAVKLVLIVGLVAIALGLGFWMWTKRRQRKHDHDGFVMTLPTPAQQQEIERQQANRRPLSLPVEP